jgi:hypothetical protein
VEHYELLRNDVRANLNDAAALCMRARKVLADARRIRQLIQVMRRERQVELAGPFEEGRSLPTTRSHL